MGIRVGGKELAKAYGKLIKAFQEQGIDISGATSREMVQAKSFVNEYLDQKVRERYADKIGALDEEKKQKIQQLAEMDRALTKIYRDPSSKFYVPLGVKAGGVGSEELRGRVQNTAVDEVEDVVQRRKVLESAIQDEIDETIDLYQELTKYRGGQEAKAKRASDTSQKERLRKEAGFDLAEKAGIDLNDAEAVTVFLQAPGDFQKWWLRNKVIAGGLPEEGFNLQDVETQLALWEEKYGKDKSSSSITSFINPSIKQEVSPDKNILGF